MYDGRIKLTREELYERVWNTPATKLAKEFWMSDVALGKLCKKLDVPKPYPGYWQQLQAGRRVHREPLPPIKQGVPAVTFIYPRREVEPFRPEDPEVIAQLERESLAENIITVPETLRGAHPLIRQTRQVLEKIKPDDYGMLWSWDRRSLNIRVSKSALNRALRVMDALLKALQARGYSAEVSKDGPAAATHIMIGAEKVKVRLSERSRRGERELSAEERRKQPHEISNRWVYRPSGELTFEIDEYCGDGGCQKKWTDKSQRPLESQLNEVLAGLVLTAESLRVMRNKREEEQRRQRELERRRMEDQERRRFLDQHREAWSESMRLREFLRACEASLDGEKGDLASDSSEAKWLRWAHRYADRIDPLKNGSFKETLLRLIGEAEAP